MYKHAALGGTFDHLHKGHKFIIDFALKHAMKISIGITTSKLYRSKEFAPTIETFSFRKNAIESYLKSKNALNKVTIFKLNTIYGTTLTDKTLDCIVVTDETELNAQKINDKRKTLGLPELKILKCSFILGPDNKIISSTNIRAGLTNRTGFPYASLFSNDILYLDEKLRKILQVPLNQPILKKNIQTTATYVAMELLNSDNLTIGVGDIVNNSLIQAGFTPDLQIVDFKTRRKKIVDKFTDKQSQQFKNDAGTLYKSAVIQVHNKIQEIIQKKIKTTLVINGEEDLLALPAILLAPLNTVVLYGQFDQGIVIVTVTEQIKEKVTKLVKKFSSSP